MPVGDRVMDMTDGRGVDLVLDHVGPALWEASLFALAPRGRLVSCGNTTGDTATIPSIGFLYSRGLAILGSDAYRPEEFAPTWRRYCEGDFAEVIETEMPLADAGPAQEMLMARSVFGKIVLRP